MERLIEDLQAFVKERDWEQFHSPKNLAMGLSIEAAELMELFLWQEGKESYVFDEEKLQKLKEEIGDIQIFLLYIAAKFSLDPIECAKEKLNINKAKYPAAKVKGLSKKYTEY